MEDYKEIRNSFEQELVDSGYRFFKDTWDNSLRGIQKRFRDNRGTKYFITITHWNMWEQYPQWRDRDLPKDSYTFKAQFNLQNDVTVDIEYSGKFIEDKYLGGIVSLSVVEKFFEDAFISMDARHYELND